MVCPFWVSRVLPHGQSSVKTGFVFQFIIVLAMNSINTTLIAMDWWEKSRDEFNKHIWDKPNNSNMANQGFAEVWIKITGERIHCSPIPIGIGMLKIKRIVAISYLYHNHKWANI